MTAPDTQIEAYQASKKTAPTLRDQVKQVLANAPEGLTPDEIAAVLDESVLSIRPRVTQLDQMGQIERTDRRRRNASGSKAAVYVLSYAKTQRSLF
ncbi:MAG: hypothetical protein ISR77_16640 [Pirellulaceae bacterium]|nr:hypothetical protein [Pirellulaceae bacterium]